MSKNSQWLGPSAETKNPAWTSCKPGRDGFCRTKTGSILLDQPGRPLHFQSYCPGGYVETIKGRIIRAYYKCLETYCEWRLGIETKGVIRNKKYSSDQHAYSPAEYHAFSFLLNKIEVDFSSTVFIDYGSGKGRIVCAASQYPFKKVMGIELSPELAASARQNIQRLTRSKAKQIEINTTDATTYELPDEPLVLFFYNPFSGPVLEEVIERIYSYLRDTGRSMMILYINDEKFKHVVKEKKLNWISQKFGTRGLPGHYSCGIYKAFL